VVGKGSRCIGLTTLPPSCADWLRILEPQPPEALGAAPGIYRDNFGFAIIWVLWNIARCLCIVARSRLKGHKVMLAHLILFSSLMLHSKHEYRCEWLIDGWLMSIGLDRLFLCFRKFLPNVIGNQ
jgi:hypothetical protein